MATAHPKEDGKVQRLVQEGYLVQVDRRYLPSDFSEYGKSISKAPDRSHVLVDAEG